MDQVDNFPFDEQTCLISIGSWVYSAKETTISTSEVELDVGANTVGVPRGIARLPYSQAFEGNSEWDVTKIVASIYSTEEDGETFQVLP